MSGAAPHVAQARSLVALSLFESTSPCAVVTPSGCVRLIAPRVLRRSPVRRAQTALRASRLEGSRVDRERTAVALRWIASALETAEGGSEFLLLAWFALGGETAQST